MSECIILAADSRVIGEAFCGSDYDGNRPEIVDDYTSR